MRSEREWGLGWTDSIRSWPYKDLAFVRSDMRTMEGLEQRRAGI